MVRLLDPTAPHGLLSGPSPSALQLGRENQRSSTMEKRMYFGLALFVLFILPLVDSSTGSGISTLGAPGASGSFGTVADGPIAYTGKGSPLAVTLKGVFTANGSAWTSSGQTYAFDFTPGASFSVTNASTVSWTAFALVSAPSIVTNVSLVINYPQEDWRPTTVTNPDGTTKSLGSDWTYTGGVLTVAESAVDTYGFWKIEFLGGNQISDLVLGVNGGSLSKTAIFDIGQTMQFQPKESYLPGSASEIRLIDPTGSLWYSSSDTNVGSTTHVIPSFRYKKDITINSAQVAADVTDFPVMLELYDTDLRTKAESDGDDILFVQNGVVVAHEIELFVQNFNSSHARLVAWVRANLTASTDSTLSMYYGNSLVGPTQNPHAVWSNGYEAVWHLGENAAGGGTHFDSTSGSYDGIQSGNVRVDGLIGNGQDFDGNNDWISIDSTEGLDPEGDITISGWFKLPYTHDSTSLTSRLIMEKYLSDGDDLHIALVGTDYGGGAADGTLVFKIENHGGSGGDGGAQYVYTSTASWAQDTWYYFSCTMDTSNSDKNKIYINGIRDDGGKFGENPYNNLTFNADWGIGGRYTDSQFPGREGWFYGSLDEVRVASGLRSAQWLRTEYFSQSSGTFYSVGTESERSFYEPSFTKILDVTAPAGLWTASVHFRDAGGTVDFRVGEYERNFIVRHTTSLSLVTSSLQTKVAGDLLYMEVSLADTDSPGPVSGSTVIANWTASGVPTFVTLEDFGDGRYGKTVDTSDLDDTGRWRIDIQSAHPYYSDASTYFELDLNHATELAYESVATTPIGFNFTASLVYRTAIGGTPIENADITFANGTPITPVFEGNGRYAISIATTGLSPGNYLYTFNATKPGFFFEMASTTVNFTLRPHHTTLSAQGGLTIPWGENTGLTIVVTDTDTGTTVSFTEVDSFSFIGVVNGPVSYTGVGPVVNLTTNAWGVGTDTLTISLTMSNPDYYHPPDYSFDVIVRAHYTSASVSGDLTTPYGNNTPLTVVLTDTDTGTVISNDSIIDTLTFTSFYGSQPFSTPSFDVTLTTNSWNVGSTAVTLSVTLVGTDYRAPSNYDFQVVISSLATDMYHEPSTLRFSTGQDFFVTLRVNVSEPGPNYGLPVTGLAQGEFSVPGYTISIDTTDQAIGRYGLTISFATHPFADGFHTITVYVNPTSINYAGTNLVITFKYEPGIAALSSPNYPQVTTPFDTDVQITLNYEDADSGAPIVGATLGGNITTYGQAFAGGVYTIWIDVTGFAKGFHRFTLWADQTEYQNKSLTFTMVIRDAFTYALPSVGALD
ncbi:MAG: DUF2341 domain-containing protein, partial [Candidatus Thorarchaeota archaeon]